MQKRIPWILLLALGAVTLSFYGFVTENLPLTIGDDLNNFQILIHTPWEAITKEAFNPITPGWHINNIDSILSSRAFNSLLMKGFYAGFGFDWNLHHLIKNLFFTLFVMSYASFCYYATRDRFLTALTSLMVVFSPPVYESVSWLVEFETLGQLFIVLAFSAFMKIYFEMDSMPRSKFWGNLVLMIWSTWWGVENRETAKMIPVVFTVFLILVQRGRLAVWVRSGIRRWIFTLAALGTFIFVIPGKTPDMVKQNYESTHLDLRQEHWMGFLNHFKNGALLGRLNGLFGPRMLLPCGMAAILVSIIFLVFYLSEKRKRPAHTTDYSLVKDRLSSFLLLGMIWFGISLLPLFLNLEIQRRYLMVQIGPGVFILSCLGALRNRAAPFKKALTAAALFVFASLWVFAGAFAIFYLRRTMNQKDIAAYGIANVMYRDYTGSAAPDSVDNVLTLYATDKILPKGAYNAIKISDWDYPQGLSAAEAESKISEIVKKWGVAYLIVTENRTEFDKAGGRLIATVPTMNKSLFCSMLIKLGIPTPGYRVYRFGSGMPPSS